MKRVVIKDLNGVQTHGAELPDGEAAAWIAEGKANNWWGQPGEYTVTEEDMTAELGEIARKTKAKEDRDTAMKVLHAKAKANALTAADRNELVRLLLLDKFPELD